MMNSITMILQFSRHAESTDSYGVYSDFCGTKTKTLHPKFTGYGDKPLENSPPPALNRTKCVPFHKYSVKSFHGASTSATVDVHGDRPHGRWGFTAKWMSEWCG
jgi:hypothetical protein